MERQVPDPHAAREAHAVLPRRLQAPHHLRRLVPGPCAARRRRHHRRDHRGAPRGRRHRRRRAPRGRHADPRHRLRDHARRRPAARARRRLAHRALGRPPRGLPRHDGRRLPELLHARRAEHGDRPHVDPPLRRGADRLRPPVHRATSSATARARSRSARSPSTRSPRRSASSSRARLARRRLQLVVPQRARRDRRSCGRARRGSSPPRCGSSTRPTTSWTGRRRPRGATQPVAA